MPALLVDEGHDAVHVGDLGLLGTSDERVLAAAEDAQRTLVTADTDFGTLLALTGSAGPSVVLLRRPGRRARSYERIHRSNLLGMGVLPLQFLDGDNAESLGLTGEETFTIRELAGVDHSTSTVTVDTGDGQFDVAVRIDTPGEGAYYRHGGILPYVLRSLLRT